MTNKLHHFAPAGVSTVELFEQEGFERTRQLGKHCWVVRREVAPA